MPTLPRRDVLRAGVGLLGVGTATVLAGCATATVSQVAPPASATGTPTPAVGTTQAASSNATGVQSSSSLAGGVRYDAGVLRTPYWPGRSVGWRVTRPVSGASALVIALHGMNGVASDWVSTYNVGAHVLETGLAVASIDGADRYWHARRDGSDTGAMVLSTFLPMLAQMGLPTARVGFTGLSMGGYGSFLLASRLGVDRVFGVATMSAALWTRLEDALPQAFDGADDFRANDVFTRTDTLRSVPTWMSCGTEDPFIVGNRAFAARMPGVTTVFDTGIHDGTYWTSHAGPALRFLAEHT